MEIKRDVSFGIIPYTYINHTLHFLVVHQKSGLRDGTYWVFPKGHSEVGESAIDTATRELKEETNLSVEFVHSQPFIITYEFVHANSVIKKTVTFFLGRVTEQKSVPDGHEILETAWLPYAQARATLSHQQTKELIDQVNIWLRSDAVSVSERK